MARPQQPELARSGKTDLDPDHIGTELEARKPVRPGGRTGPVPPENQPGHHPSDDQDKPDLDAFAAKLTGDDRPADDRPADDRPAAAAPETPPAPRAEPAGSAHTATKSPSATKAQPTAKTQPTPAKRPAGTPGWPESAPAPQDPGPLGEPASTVPAYVEWALLPIRATRQGLEWLERSINDYWSRRTG
jgi:hypothetical protein